jgi:MoaA/NifB/PqqE/SkfB family radical SAM enzyme
MVMNLWARQLRGRRLLLETDKRLLWKLAWNMGFKGMLSVQRHKRPLKRGEFFPPFLYVSIINSCNLRCQGCWVDVAAKQETIEPAAFHKLVREAKAMGNVFFGIVGGEPFMHPESARDARRTPTATSRSSPTATSSPTRRRSELRQLGNVTPLISVEGNEIVSDERRGRERRAISKTMEGLQNCLKHKVITGVCTELCQTNISTTCSREKWLDRLIEMGVMYTWFHVYRPMGPDAEPRPVPDARAAACVPQVRRRDAGEEADHHHRRLLRRRR